MGLIIGKLWRKKTTVEVLEKLDKEIKSIEEYRKNTELTNKRIVGRFIIISVGIYIVTAFLFYFYFFPATFYDRLFYIIPLILAPVIILTVKRVLTWYYKWKISRKQTKLSTLKEEKKKMLEKVMETETYKIAKTILEKFSEPTTIQKSMITSDIPTPRKPMFTPGGLRQRALPAPSTTQMVPSATPFRTSATPFRPSLAISQSTTVLRSDRTPLPPAVTMQNTFLPMPRKILPRDRSVFDKMVDYLVGDGPTNRYALICKHCSSHNGMAIRQEFEYISFRCCYCYTLNPARKKRPVGPKLDSELKPPQLHTDSSESDKNSPSDTDSEVERKEATKSEVKVEEDIDESVPMELDTSLEEKEKSMEVSNSLEEKDETIIEETKVEEIEEEIVEGEKDKIEIIKVKEEPNSHGDGIVQETD